MSTIFPPVLCSANAAAGGGGTLQKHGGRPLHTRAFLKAPELHLSTRNGVPRSMALKATIHKAELEIVDMDRNYYATHRLTLACHPSETGERLMVRLLAFALNAQERLEFGKGISDSDEPDLWMRDLTGAIGLWIELGPWMMPSRAGCAGGTWRMCRSVPQIPAPCTRSSAHPSAPYAAPTRRWVSPSSRTLLLCAQSPGRLRGR
jgi:hypothetical protein